jgi:hypothetical protein
MRESERPQRPWRETRRGRHRIVPSTQAGGQHDPITIIIANRSRRLIGPGPQLAGVAFVAFGIGAAWIVAADLWLVILLGKIPPAAPGFF